MNRYISFVFLLLISTTGLAKEVTGAWEIQSGDLQYHVHFTLKEVVGKSQRVKGKGLCTKGDCQFLIAAPVNSFESGDGNRDSHMQEVTKAALHPMTAVKISHRGEFKSGSQPLDVEVNFAGKTHVYKNVPVEIDFKDDSKAVVKGSVPLLLSHFSVERPSLLSVPISDNVEIDFNLNWSKTN